MIGTTLFAVLSEVLRQPHQQVGVCTGTPFFGISPWYACLPRDAAGNPAIKDINDLFLIIFPVVESLIKVAVLVAAGMIFYLLIQYQFSRGDTGKIATVTSGLRDAIIGLLICFVAIAVVNFVSGAFDASNAGVLNK